MFGSNQSPENGTPYFSSELLDSVIKKMNEVSTAMADLANLLSELSSDKTVPLEKETVSVEMIMKQIKQLCNLGHIEEAKTLIKKHGGNSLSEIDSEQYSSLYEETLETIQKYQV